MKWFTAKNLPELKNSTRTWRKSIIPIMGGTDQEMASINNEYDILSGKACRTSAQAAKNTSRISAKTPKHGAIA